MPILYNSQSFVYYRVYTNIKLMSAIIPTTSPPHKRSNQNIKTIISPYFASVRRNIHGNKNKKSVQNAISIIKYPSSITSQQTHSSMIDEKIGEQKKKVFKRFGKFQQVDHIYTIDMKNPRTAKENEEKGKEENKEIKARRNNSKQIIFSNKTLALVDKYSSYKSIAFSTPKISREKDKIKRNSFRTKTRSGNTLHWGSKQNIEASCRKQKQSQVQNEDWLCKQLIQHEVYGVSDEECY